MPVNRAFTKPDGLPQPGEMFALKFKAQLPLEEEFLKEIGNPLVLRPEDSESWRDDLEIRLDYEIVLFQNDLFASLPNVKLQDQDVLFFGSWLCDLPDF